MALWDYASASELWHFATGFRTNAHASIADLDGNGKLNLIPHCFTPHNAQSGDGVNGNGTTTYDNQTYSVVMDEDGEEQFAFEWRSVLSTSEARGRTSHFIVDFTGDGTNEIVVLEEHPSSYPGPDRLHLLGDNGTHLDTLDLGTTTERLRRGDTAIGDLNNDGNLQIVTSTSANSMLYVIDHNLDVQDSAQLGLATFVADITGDGYLEIGVRDGTTFRLLDKDLNELYAFDTGDAVRQAIPVDLDGDGRIEVAVATENDVHLLGRP